MITYVVTACLSFTGHFLIRNSERRGVDTRLCMLLPFVVMMLFADNTPDHKVYETAYYTGRAPYFESGIKIITELLKRIGIENFFVFKCLIVALVIFTFCKWGKVVPNIATTILLYNLFVQFYDVIQMRYTIAEMLILLSLYFIIKKQLVVAIVTGVASIYFHRLALLPLLFLICIYFIRPKKDYSLRNTETVVILTGGFIGVFLSKLIVGTIAESIPFFERINMYMTGNTSIDSFLIWGGYEGFILFAMYYLGYNNFVKNPHVDNEKKAAINMLFRFMLYGIAVSGFLLYVQEFNRLYRLLFISGYLMFGIIEDSMEKTNRDVLFAMLSVASIAFMAVAMLRGINFDTYW